MSRALVAGLVLIGCAAACSGGDDDAAAVAAAGGAAGSTSAARGGGLPAPPADKPAVDRSPPSFTEAQTTSVEVGPDGGTISLPLGISLEVPAGALASPTTITLGARSTSIGGRVAYVIEALPDGLTFAKPATLWVPYPDSSPAAGVAAMGWSNQSPLVDKGSEKTRFVPLDLAATPSMGRAGFVVDHFTFFFASIATHDKVDAILDLPPRFLKPGDLLFTLSGGIPGPGWNPGHVGLFTGGRTVCTQTVVDELIEAQEPMVRVSHLEDIVSAELADDGLPKSREKGFRTEYDHLYLGARRPHDGPLSDIERTQVVGYARDKVGLPYTFVFGEGNLGQGMFSCVGLTERALDAAGRGVLNIIMEGLASTPWEQYGLTRPIDQLETFVGEKVEVTLRALVLHPKSPTYTWLFSGGYCPRFPCCDGDACNEAQASAFGTLPGGQFTEVSPGVWKLTFDPRPEDEGKTFSVDFRLTSAPFLRDGDGGHERQSEETVWRSLDIKVVPCPGGTGGGSGVSSMGGGGSGTSPGGAGGSSMAAAPTFGVSPIRATFMQDIFSTDYAAIVSNPSGEALSVRWSGPDCGSFMPMSESLPAMVSDREISMRWEHPHPPCDETTQHADKTVELVVEGQSGKIRCSYKGAETGMGGPCLPM